MAYILSHLTIHPGSLWYWVIINESYNMTHNGLEKNSKNFVKFVGMESFLTAVSDLIPALQKHRAKFRIGSTNRLKWMVRYQSYDIIDMTHIRYDSKYMSHTMWTVSESAKSLLVTFICFSVGSAFCMEGGFHTFKVSQAKIWPNLTRTEPQMVFWRFLIDLVPLDLHYCGFLFGSQLQSDGDMVVTNICVTLDECVRQNVTHTSNTASNILLQSSLW